MEWESSDLVVGAAVLGAAAIALAGLFWLSPAAAGDTYPLYTSFDRIDGIGVQSNVELQGYSVGRVGAIEPRLGDGSALRFQVRLDIQTELPGGDSLHLPQGTAAHLVPPPVIGSGLIRLVVPPGGGPSLEPGSVIPGIRAPAMLEQVETVTTGVNAELAPTLESARALMDSISMAVSTANASVRTTARSLPVLIAGLERQLEATYDLTVGLTTQVDTLSPVAIAAIDSTMLLLSDVRAMVGDVRGTVSATTPDLPGIVARLDTTMVLLTHFVRQVTRRPWKTLTGVDPPEGLEPPPPGPAIAPGSPGDTVPAWARPDTGSVDPDPEAGTPDAAPPGPGDGDAKPDTAPSRTEGPDAPLSPIGVP